MLASLFGALSLAAAPAPPPPGSIQVPGGPTGVALSRDGKALVVSFEGPFGVGGGVVAYRRNGDAYDTVGTLKMKMPVEALALTPDDRTAVVTTRVGVAAFDLTRFLAGDTPEPVEVRDGPAPDANQVVVSRDGDYAFYTVKRYATLGVARIAQIGRESRPAQAIVGHVPLDGSPGGVSLSPDGRSLYVTSEMDNVDADRVPGASDARLGRKRCAANFGPHGVLSIVDTAKAIVDSAHAVVARVAAGCAPTRVALSPDGSVAWVTVRGENRVLAFDSAKVRSDPEHALLASVDVGDVPIGLALSPDGRRLVVADSHRSMDADEVRSAGVTVIDPLAALAGKTAVVATLPSGALAREVTAAPDGTFYVTDYLAKAIDVILPSRLP